MSLDNIVGTFGDSWGRIDYTVNDSVLSIKEKLDSMGQKTGHSTDITKAMEYLLKKKIKVDRIIIISDMNIYNSNSIYHYKRVLYDSPQVMIQKYQNKINPDAYIFSINIAGAKDAQVDPKNPRVHLLSGWSEKIVDLLVQLEGKQKVQTSKADYTIPTMDLLRQQYKMEIP